MRLISIDGPQKQLERLAYLLHTKISQHYFGYKLFLNVSDDCPIYKVEIKDNNINVIYGVCVGAKKRNRNITMERLLEIVLRYQS